MTHNTSYTLAVAIFLAAIVTLAPQVMYAQEEVISGTLLTNTATMSGTIQITAEDPQAIRTLLEGEAAIPGGYPSYGWATFWAVIFGGLGGLVFELLRLRGLLPLPHLYPAGQIPDTDLFKLDGYIRPRQVIDLGFVARIFVGAMAALAVLLVVSPPQRMQFIAATVLAGSAGASIFDSLRARLTASLAIADATDVRLKGQELQERLNQMETLVNQLLAQSRTINPVAEVMSAHAVQATPREDGQTAPALAQQVPQLDVELLDQLSRTLGEAKGIRSSMDRPRSVDYEHRTKTLHD